MDNILIQIMVSVFMNKMASIIFFTGTIFRRLDVKQAFA